MQTAVQQSSIIDTNNIIKLRPKTDRPYYRHKPSGKSSEVYAFRTAEELQAIINVLDKHILEAKTEYNKMIWNRNKLLFILGINIALRGSDLSQLRWCDILKSDGSIKDNTKIQPQKTKQLGKFVFVQFNSAAKQAVEDYLNLYPYDDINDYVFISKKGDSITTHQIWTIIKKISAEAGIEQNIGSHSLRKTFGYWVWHNAEDKDRALVLLQMIFNHSSTKVTMHYIGIQQDDLSNVYNGLDYQI